MSNTAILFNSADAKEKYYPHNRNNKAIFQKKIYDILCYEQRAPKYTAHGVVLHYSIVIRILLVLYGFFISKMYDLHLYNNSDT